MGRIRIERNPNPQTMPPSNQLGFGQVFSNHMFLMNYNPKEGWHDARIVPYGPLSIDPAAIFIHYSQAIFEGLKAYKHDDGKTYLFRPDQNFARMLNSCDILEMPHFDRDLAYEGLLELLKIDADCMPDAPCTMYIRPFMIGIDPILGVKSSQTYLFCIILSPSGAYSGNGLEPIKIAVENHYVRAVRGGIGEAKTGGNYAASLRAYYGAHDQGYSQVLWLDGVEHKYVDECGAMNVFFVIDGEVVTPELNGCILPGITRKSSIELLRHLGYKVTERKVAIEEVAQAWREGKLNECFATGTAAVVNPIGELAYHDEKMVINNFTAGPITTVLYNTLTGIQWGHGEDPFHWVVEVK